MPNSTAVAIFRGEPSTERELASGSLRCLLDGKLWKCNRNTVRHGEEEPDVKKLMIVVAIIFSVIGGAAAVTALMSTHVVAGDGTSTSGG
jgi:hypothetical protein